MTETGIKNKEFYKQVYLCFYHVHVLWTVTKYYSESGAIYETVDKCLTNSSWVKRHSAVFVFSHHHGSDISAEGCWSYRRRMTTAPPWLTSPWSFMLLPQNSFKVVSGWAELEVRDTTLHDGLHPWEDREVRPPWTPVQEQSPEAETQKPSPDHLHPGPGDTELPYQPQAGGRSHTTAHNTVCVSVWTTLSHHLLVLFLSQTFSGMSSDGSPLVYHLPDRSYPSQHHNRLDLSDSNAPPYCSLQTHTKEVYGFKAVSAVSWAVWHRGTTLVYLYIHHQPWSALLFGNGLLHCYYTVITLLLACLLHS